MYQGCTSPLFRIVLVEVAVYAVYAVRQFERRIMRCGRIYVIAFYYRTIGMTLLAVTPCSDIDIKGTIGVAVAACVPEMG